MPKQPRSHSVMECRSLLFSCTHFPSTCLAYFYFCSPTFPQNYFDHPQRRAANSLLSIKCGSGDEWIALKCYHSVAGKLRPSLETPNWFGAAMHPGLSFVTMGVKIGLRVSFFSDELLSVWLSNIRANCHSSKPDWVLIIVFNYIKLHWGC